MTCALHGCIVQNYIMGSVGFLKHSGMISTAASSLEQCRFSLGVKNGRFEVMNERCIEYNFASRNQT